MKPLLLEKLTQISANAPAHGKHILVGDLRVRYLDNWAQNTVFGYEDGKQALMQLKVSWANQAPSYLLCNQRRRCSLSGLLSKVLSSNKQEWMSAMTQKSSQKWEFRNANLNRSMCYTQTRWGSQQKRSPLCEQRGAIWNRKSWNFSSGFDTESLLTEFLHLSMAEAYHSL